MICVDTNIWIETQRSPALLQQLRSLLRRGEVLLPVVVRVELLAGSGRPQRVERDLEALSPVEPGHSAWAQIEQWARAGAAAGQHFGMSDLIIAALAAERDAAVWTREEDFTRMAALGWIKLHVV